MTRLEKKAALAVLGMAAGVTVAGVRLMRRHAAYMTKKAAAFFAEDERRTETEAGAEADVRADSLTREKGSIEKEADDQ